MQCRCNFGLIIIYFDENLKVIIKKPAIDVSRLACCVLDGLQMAACIVCTKFDEP